jgi:hypothetical protein
VAEAEAGAGAGERARAAAAAAALSGAPAAGGINPYEFSRAMICALENCGAGPRPIRAAEMGEGSDSAGVGADVVAVGKAEGAGADGAEGEEPDTAEPAANSIAACACNPDRIWLLLGVEVGADGGAVGRG